jgi:hypothetical protein
VIDKEVFNKFIQAYKLLNPNASSNKFIIVQEGDGFCLKYLFISGPSGPIMYGNSETEVLINYLIALKNNQDNTIDYLKHSLKSQLDTREEVEKLVGKYVCLT